MTQLKVGDEAPPFALRDQNGRTVRLADFRGRRVLLYFYPAADTPGCTKQSCSVRDAREDFASLGVEVLGVSPDPPEAQKSFDEKYGLGFPLLCDVDHSVADAYGVWGEHTVSGIEYVGVLRTALLIDESGTVLEAWYGVRPEDTVPYAAGVLTR